MRDFWIWILLAPAQYAFTPTGLLVAGGIGAVVLLYLVTEWIGFGRPLRLAMLALLRLCVALALAWFAVVCGATAMLGVVDGPYLSWLGGGAAGLFSAIVVAAGSALWIVVGVKVILAAVRILIGPRRQPVM